MIFLLFILYALIVFTFTIFLSNNAEWLEKNTKMSGAVAGFLLATATSLPELISSSTSVLIGQPELAIANILGSNMFNYTIVAFTNIMFISYFAFNHVKKSTTNVTIIAFIIYVILIFATLINKFTNIVLDIPIKRISLVTILIAIIYFISVKFLDTDDDSEDSSYDSTKKEVRILTAKSILYAIILIFFSAKLAQTAEKIMVFSGISATLAGTVLLGASTSLPEFVGAINLMKKRAYDIAISSVLASNIFNFFVLFVIDIITPSKIITKVDNSLLILAVFGFITTIIVHITIRYTNIKNKLLYLLPSLLIISIYGIYLVMFS